MEAVSTDDVLSAFYLQQDGGTVELLPVSGSVGSSGIRLVWAAGALVQGTSYSLRLRPRRLVTSSGAPVMLMSDHSYRAVPTDYCGSNGHFNSEFLCVCREGFGGSDCSTCGVGYVAKQGSSPLQCIKTLRPVCQPCSCGCDSDNQPLGLCDDSTGVLTCSCSPS